VSVDHFSGKFTKGTGFQNEHPNFLFELKISKKTFSDFFQTNDKTSIPFYKAQKAPLQEKSIHGQWCDIAITPNFIQCLVCKNVRIISPFSTLN
jgi:hypothetical protein